MSLILHYAFKQTSNLSRRSGVIAVIYSVVVIYFTYFFSTWLFWKAPQTNVINQIKYQWWPLILMWIPGILAFIFRGFTRQGFSDVGWQVGKKSYWFLAVGVPFIAATFTYAVGYFAGKVSINPDIFQETMFVDKFGLLPQAWPVGTLHSFMLRLMLKLILVATIGMIPNFIFALGEELGWRGYLQPHLLRSGFRYPYALSGFIWSIWHLPWLTHQNTWEVALFILCITFLGIWIGWVKQASGSIWVATMAHAAHNTFFFTLYASCFQINTSFWISEAGILPILAYGTVLLVLSLKLRSSFQV